MTDHLIVLAKLKKSLQIFMNPKILNKFVDFLESTGGDNSMLERYQWFAENGEDGKDCKYAKLSKEFFEKDHARAVAQNISWLYHNWARKELGE